MITTMLTQFACTLPSRVQMVPTWYKYLDGESIGGKCSPRVTIPNDITPILLALFELILFIGGIVAVGFIIYGGIQYILSQGEPDRTKNARTTIVNAVVGLVIAMLSTAVVNLISGSVG